MSTVCDCGILSSSDGGFTWSGAEFFDTRVRCMPKSVYSACARACVCVYMCGSVRICACVYVYVCVERVRVHNICMCVNMCICVCVC